jgi:hypothetical protein
MCAASPAPAARRVIAQRFTAQLLSGPPAQQVTDVADRLLAVQAQDPRGARLAIRARSTGLSAHDVDDAFTRDRSIVVSWLNRGTLHLVRAEDYWWLHPLTTPRLSTGTARRLAQEGVSPDAAERGVAVIEHALADHGPQTRSQLRARLDAAGVRTAGQAQVHILVLASLRGSIVRGPMVGAHQAFVLVRDWLGTPPPALDHDVALGELARRYLVGHAPAGAADLAKWAGIPLGESRRGLRAIGAAIVERADGLVALAGSAAANRSDVRATTPSLPRPRLLGAFDPLLLGWASREPILGSHRGVVTVNGLFRPIALVKGRAAATWSMPNRTVVLAPFEPISDSHTRALHRDGGDVVRFLFDRPAR